MIKTIISIVVERDHVMGAMNRLSILFGRDKKAHLEHSNGAFWGMPRLPRPPRLLCYLVIFYKPLYLLY